MWTFAAISRRKKESVVSNPTRTDSLYKKRIEITTFILPFVRRERKLRGDAREMGEGEKEGTREMTTSVPVIRERIRFYLLGL